MAQIVKLRRSSVPGQKPTNSNLQLGELALNTTDGKVYMAVSGSLGPSVEELISTNTVNTGSLHLVGSITASAFSGSASGLTNVPFHITGSDVEGNTYNKQFTKLQFDDSTGLNVSESVPGTAFISIGSHFKDIFVSGSPILSATGSDAFEVIGAGGLGISTSITDTNGNGYIKELTISAVSLSSSLNNRMDTITGSITTLSSSLDSRINTLNTFTSSVVLTSQTSSMNVLSASYALTAAFALNASAGNNSVTDGAYAVLNQTTPATTWTFKHSLGQRYPIFQVFDSNGVVIIPSQITTIDVDNATITFPSNQTGKVIASLGTGPGGLSQYFSSNATWSLAHNLGSDYPIVTIWDTNRNIIFPQRIESVDTNNIKVYFSTPIAGYVNVAKGGHIISGSVVAGSIDYVGSNIVSSSVQILITGTTGYSTFSGSISSSIGSLSSSVATTTLGLSSSILSLSSSVALTTSGLTSTITTLSSSLSGSIDSLSSSVASINNTQNGRLDSLETASGSIRNNFNTFTSSYNTGSFTGSFKGDGTNLYNIPASGVTGLELYKIVSGSVSASISPNNGFRVNTDVYIDGTLTAKEIHTDYVTSSVLYQSGSTKFGDTSDDNHLFTGSVLVNGNVSATSITGSINFNNLTNVPTLVSGSSQINITGTTDYSTFSSSVSTSIGSLSSSVATTTSDLSSSIGSLSSSIATTTLDLKNRIDSIEGVTGSISSLNSFTSSINTTIKSKLDADGVISGSSQIIYSGLTGIPSGIVSGSEQLTGSYDTRYVLSGSITQTTWDNIASKPNDIVSSSNQISAFGFLQTSSFNTYTSSNDGRVSSLESFTASLNTNYVSETEFGTYTGSINTFTSSVNSYTSSNDGRVSSLESKTGSYATTGSNLFKGNQTISGSIIPAVDNTYDLGSLTNQFRDLYLSSASLYIDGTKVLGSTAQELQITTDTGQSFKILEASSDTITLQSADGNITLATSGGGDVIMDPTTGVIALKGTTTLYAGNKIVSSDGNSVQFGNGIAITGSVVSTVTPLVSGSSQINYSGLTGIPSGIISGSSQIDITGTTGYSTFSSSISTSIGSLSSSVATTTSGLSSSIGSLSSSVATTTLGTKNRVDSIETTTGSLNTFTSSASGRLTSLETASGSIRTDFNTYTGSNNTTNTTQDGRLTSIEGITGSISSLNTYTGSNNTVIGTLQTSTSSLNSYTSSNTTNIDAIHTSTGSFKSFTSSFDTAFGMSGADVTVKGNLTVSGTQTTVNSTTVAIGDNIIQLNGTGATNAGLVVRDATAPNTVSGSFLWDSTNDKWIAGALGSEDDVVLKTATQTLTNKTINASQLVDASVTNAKLQYSSLSIAGTSVSLNGSISAATILSGTGTVSGSSQISHDSTTGYVANRHIDHTAVSISAGNGLSGGGDISATRTISLDTTSATFTTGVKSKMNADGVISGSAQISFNGITDKPTLVSGSSQITYGSLSGIPTGIVSGSSQITFGSISSIPSGLVSGSSQIDLTATTNYASGILTRLNAVGVFSGSAQVTLSSTTGYGSVLNQAVLTSSSPTFAGLTNNGTYTQSTTSTQPVYITGDSGDTSGIFRIQIDSVSDSFGTGARTFLGDGGIDIFLGTGNSSYTPSNTYIALNHSGEISMGAGSATKHFTLSTGGNLTISGTIGASNLSGTNTGDETLARINALAITTVGTITSGTWNGTAIGNSYLANSSFNIGTTSISLGRASASQTLTGVSIDGNAATASSAGVLTASGGLTTQYGNGTVGYSSALVNPQTGLFAAVDNSNSILTVNRHPDNYYSQLGFSSNGNLYYRSFSATAINTSQAWQTIWTSSSLTNLNQLTNGPGYITGISFANVSSKPTTLSGYGITDALSNNADSEQDVGTRNLYYNDGVKRVFSDPRWNESGYDADLGTLHIYSTTAAGANYGRAGIALYHGSAYQYLTTKASTTGLFVNNSLILTAGNYTSYAMAGAGYSANQNLNTTSSPTFAGLSSNGTITITSGTPTGAASNNANSYLRIDSAANQYIELRTNASASGAMQGMLFTDNGVNGFIGFKEYTGGSNYGEAIHISVTDYSASDAGNGIYLGASSNNANGVTTPWFSIRGGTSYFYGNVLPDTNNSRNLGSASVGWANVYTNDLHLSNMNKPEGNDVDGTNGNWTIQEGLENLYIINNNNGKKFKISLEEII